MTEETPAPVPENLTVGEEEFCRLYVHGDADADHTLVGNASRSYHEAYDCTLSTARSAAYRLLRRDRVRARIKELREEARSVLDEVMPDWKDEVRSAMRTLRWARTGKWPDRFEDDDQAKRSAVEAAKHTLDRALGSPKQMHELDVNRRSIVVQVAGPPHEPQEEDAGGGPDGREVSSGSAAGGELPSSQDRSSSSSSSSDSGGSGAVEVGGAPTRTVRAPSSSGGERGEEG